MTKGKIKSANFHDFRHSPLKFFFEIYKRHFLSSRSTRCKKPDLKIPSGSRVMEWQRKGKAEKKQKQKQKQQKQKQKNNVELDFHENFFKKLISQKRFNHQTFFIKNMKLISRSYKKIFSKKLSRGGAIRESRFWKSAVIHIIGTIAPIDTSKKKKDLRAFLKGWIWMTWDQWWKKHLN
jgi:hypothetical protein